MKHSLLQDADVCRRCLSRVTLSSAASRRPPRAVWHRALSTSAAPAQDTQVNITKHDDRGRFRKESRDGRARRKDVSERVRPTAWTAFLKTKYLGRPASVLVLRDAEKNKNYRESDRPAAVEQRDLKDVNIAELMASVDAQKSAPGQEEVNEYIERLRPTSSVRTMEESPTLSRAQFDRILQDLDTSFNQLQISRYITIQEGSRLVKEQDHARERRKTATGERMVARSDWYAVDASGRPMASQSRSAKRRGKKGLVELLMRSIWGIKVAEETLQIGCIDMKVRESAFSLLNAGSGSGGAADSGSALDHFQKQHEVMLDFDHSSQTLKITADQQRATQAADALEAVVAGFHVERIDLGPFFDRARFHDPLSHTQARLICESLRCTLQKGAQLSKINERFIRGLNADSISQCRRALYAAARPIFTDDTTRLGSTPGEEAALWAVADAGSSTLAIQGRRPLGRLVQSKRMSAGQTPTKLWADHATLTPDLYEEVTSTLDHVSNKDAYMSSSSREGKTHEMFSTIFGHINGALAGNGMQELSFSQAQSAFQTSAPIFTPISTGLPQLLLSEMQEGPSREDTSIRIRLVPSPWSAHAEVRAPIELSFSIDPGSRSVSFQKAELVNEIRRMNLMLPRLATDVRVDKLVTEMIAYAAQDSSMAAFIRDIEDRGSGYAKMTAPPFVLTKTHLPRHVRAYWASKENSIPSETEYFTASIEITQSLHFIFRGFDLVYQRSGKGETGGKSDSLSLNMTPGTAAKAERSRELSDGLRGHEAENGKSHSEEYREAINEILYLLNTGTGKSYTDLDAAQVARMRRMEVEQDVGLDALDDLSTFAGRS